MYCTQCGTHSPDDARFCHNCGYRLVPETNGRPEYAGFWRRFIAYIVDRMILALPSIAVVLLFIVPSVLNLVSNVCNPVRIPFAVLSFIGSWVWLVSIIVLGHLLYFTWFESSSLQATPGKMLLGIIVTDFQGRRISFLRSLGRNVGKVISHMVFNIGFIMAGLTARKQGLHDMLADCLVVMRK